MASRWLTDQSASASGLVSSRYLHAVSCSRWYVKDELTFLVFKSISAPVKGRKQKAELKFKVLERKWAVSFLKLGLIQSAMIVNLGPQTRGNVIQRWLPGAYCSFTLPALKSPEAQKTPPSASKTFDQRTLMEWKGHAKVYPHPKTSGTVYNVSPKFKTLCCNVVGVRFCKN